jgi:hypothetical protein
MEVTEANMQLVAEQLVGTMSGDPARMKQAEAQ